MQNEIRREQIPLEGGPAWSVMSPHAGWSTVAGSEHGPHSGFALRIREVAWGGGGGGGGGEGQCQSQSQKIQDNALHGDVSFRIRDGR